MELINEANRFFNHRDFINLSMWHITEPRDERLKASDLLALDSSKKSFAGSHGWSDAAFSESVHFDITSGFHAEIKKKMIRNFAIDQGEWFMRKWMMRKLTLWLKVDYCNKIEAKKQRDLKSRLRKWAIRTLEVSEWLSDLNNWVSAALYTRWEVCLSYCRSVIGWLAPPHVRLATATATFPQSKICRTSVVGVGINRLFKHRHSGNYSSDSHPPSRLKTPKMGMWENLRDRVKLAHNHPSDTV